MTTDIGVSIGQSALSTHAAGSYPKVTVCPLSLAKLVVDQIIAALLLLVLVPLLLVVAVAIKLDSRGPVFFRQTRVGRGGRCFQLWKFRSMVVNAEALHPGVGGSDADGVLFKARHDPRVTRVGGLLRRLSLDELPQLFNVLTGSMSLVGPRPALPREVAQYPPQMYRRLAVRPGITGLWQVSGRSDLSWEDTIHLDTFYAEQQVILAGPEDLVADPRGGVRPPRRVLTLLIDSRGCIAALSFGTWPPSCGSGATCDLVIMRP